MNFVKGLLSNRFGIILATINVCGFVLYFQSYENCYPSMPKLIFTVLNIPALSFSGLCGILVHVFTNEFITSGQIAFFFYFLVSFFIILQWLFIAKLARAIAEK